MSNKLKVAVDAKVGEYNWYIAGGAAAYWHIDNYAKSESRDRHDDLNYYESIRKLIFPSDVEGNAISEVELDLDGKYGLLKVRLQEMNGNQLNEMKQQQDLVVIDGILVLNIEKIIDIYRRSSDQNKVEKRNTRIALLKIVKNKEDITQDNVQKNMSSGDNLGAEILKGIQLKSTKKH